MAEGNDLPCQEFVELVTEYLEGALPAPERERVEAHLADCEYCVDYLDQIRLTIRAIGRLSDERLSPAARLWLLTEFRDWKRALGNTPAP